MLAVEKHIIVNVITDNHNLAPSSGIVYLKNARSHVAGLILYKSIPVIKLNYWPLFHTMHLKTALNTETQMGGT